MDSDLAMIFSFVLALLLVLLPFAFLVNLRSQRHEERKLELELELEQAKKGQAGIQSQEFKHMEDRLRVLERIATDPSADISRQIDDLRTLQADGEKVT